MLPRWIRSSHPDRDSLRAFRELFRLPMMSLPSRLLVAALKSSDLDPKSGFTRGFTRKGPVLPVDHQDREGWYLRSEIHRVLANIGKSGSSVAAKTRRLDCKI